MATVEKINVNTNRLSKTAEKVNNDIRDMSTELLNMEQSVKELDAMWDGESSEAFKAAFHRDIQLANQMIVNLNDIYQYEQNAKTEYEKCEQKVAQLIEEIMV